MAKTTGGKNTPQTERGKTLAKAVPTTAMKGAPKGGKTSAAKVVKKPPAVSNAIAASPATKRAKVDGNSY